VDISIEGSLANKQIKVSFLKQTTPSGKKVGHLSKASVRATKS